MTDEDEEDVGVPGSAPRHLDPAGKMADAVESGEFDLRTDPGLEATVRIVRTLLEGDSEGSTE